MQLVLRKLKLLEFEWRIFVSFGIVLMTCAVSYSAFSNSLSTLALAGTALGLSERTSLTAGYLGAALVMAFASILRMWAGSVLTPHRVMAFRVQVDAMKTSGPYRIVRNPIYLADLIAMCAFGVCMPPVGLVMPFLFAFHYHRLILYEEESLRREYGNSFDDYRSLTPRMFPTVGSLRRTGMALREFAVTREGFRHNALYVLFVPGFLLAALTTQFALAVLVGLPAVLDWAIIHTKIGLKR